MQLIDDRNPCRNAAKVTAGIQKQHGWGGCEGADGSELGLGKAWLTGKLCSRRKEKTVWGGKNGKKCEPSGKGESVTKGLAPVCNQYRGCRKPTWGEL